MEPLQQKYCPPPGRSLPPPTNLQPLPAIDDFLTTLQSFPWFKDTTIVIKASIDGSSVFEYAHGAGQQDAGKLHETQIRIASVTKVFTVLAVLLSRPSIGWGDSIAKFVPGLDEEAYAEVTIGSLADQTSGLGRFVRLLYYMSNIILLTTEKGYVGDLALIPGFSPSQLGLPTVTDDLPSGDVYPGGKVCSRDEVIEMFNKAAYLPTSPNSGPMYSNISYNLLGMALEHVHSKPYTQIIQELIFDPIGMRNSSFRTPTDSSTAILPRAGDRWFAHEFGKFDPCGGIWSTANDMLLFLEAIQTHRILSPAQTRKWLQPSSLLPSLHQLVGAPWEIFRPTDIDLAVPRPIDLYTKAGGVAGYASYAVLVPEHSIALTIHVAGNDATAATQPLLPMIAKPLIAYADHQARRQAAEKYAGTYRSGDGSSVISISVDDGPGLRIGTAILNNVAIVSALATTQGLNPSNASARLYPSGFDVLHKEKEQWSMLLDRINEGTARGFAEQYCASWNWGDKLRYATQSLDGVAFHLSEGKVTGIEMVVWRILLSKVHESEI